MDEIEAPPGQEPPHRPPRRQGVERGDERRPPPHPLVGRQGPAVAEDLPGRGGVGEGDDLDPIRADACERQPLAARQEDGHPVAGADERPGQVADERTRGVLLEAGVGLGEEEEIEAGGGNGRHSTRSLTE